MKLVQENYKNNNINISLTAYRAIKILKMLIEKPCSNSEIVKELKEDEITKKSTSDDTLRVTINSLKAVGCQIARPTPANNFKYVLLSHPFNIQFNDSQIKILLKLRNYILNNNWKEIVELNHLLEKIITSSGNEHLLDLLNYKKPFRNIPLDILKTLLSDDLINKEILITYKTSKNKISDISILVDSIFYEAERIYILGFYRERNSYSYFNVEKISAIHSVKSVPKDYKTDFSKAIYKIFGDDIKTFKQNSDEKIILSDKNFILIESYIKSDFKILQRLLTFGKNFEIITPNSLKEQLSEKISKMFERY